MKCVVSEGVILSRPLDGPLAADIVEFAKWLLNAGYALYSRRRRVLLAACFSRWLGRGSISARCITPEHVSRYL
jgi:hypothetical protein